MIALQKMWKMFFILSKKLFSFKFLCFCLPLFFSQSAIALEVDPRKIYDVINWLSKNLITHFVWYLEKEIGCDIETLSIIRVSNKEHFYGKIMQKMCTKSELLFNFAM